MCTFGTLLKRCDPFAIVRPAANNFHLLYELLGDHGI